VVCGGTKIAYIKIMEVNILDKKNCNRASGSLLIKNVWDKEREKFASHACSAAAGKIPAAALSLAENPFSAPEGELLEYNSHGTLPYQWKLRCLERDSGFGEVYPSCYMVFKDESQFLGESHLENPPLQFLGSFVRHLFSLLYKGSNALWINNSKALGGAVFA